VEVLPVAAIQQSINRMQRLFGYGWFRLLSRDSGRGASDTFLTKFTFQHHVFSEKNSFTNNPARSDKPVVCPAGN
jgi:hypothetical protein